ncbi:hypothetical protein JKP88DRAFT_263867 [Tribonema minus]|uniref:ubiquitinyl hydrolase 1 n=1 Tax=Tribonema minus TaxID=303371 RepID=A0A835YT66_9STRA|nr:hypothetical protein JKP88DRAFT_263867 [Tribonema minus]
MAAHPADQLDTLLKAAAKKNRGNGLNPATACRDALTDHPWLEFNAVKTGPQHFTVRVNTERLPHGVAKPDRLASVKSLLRFLWDAGEHRVIEKDRQMVDNKAGEIEAERRRLDAERQTERQALTEQRQQLEAERNALAAERQALAAERQAFKVDRQRLDTELQQLGDAQALVRAEQQTDRQQLEAAQQQVATERQALEADRQRLDTELQQLADAQALVRAEQQTDRQQLEAAQQQLEAERRALAEERRAFKVDRQRLDTELQQLGDAQALVRAEQQTDRQQLEAAQQQLAAERRALAAERQALEANRQRVDTELQQLGDAQALVRAEQQLEAAQQQLAAERRALAAERQALEADRQRVDTELQQLADAQALVRAEQQTDRQQLETGQQQLEAERQALQADRQRLDTELQQLADAQALVRGAQAEQQTDWQQLEAGHRAFAAERQAFAAERQAFAAERHAFAELQEAQPLGKAQRQPEHPEDELPVAEGDTDAVPRRGLPNCASACHLLAVVQLVCHTPSLRRLMRGTSAELTKATAVHSFIKTVLNGMCIQYIDDTPKKRKRGKQDDLDDEDDGTAALRCMSEHSINTGISGALAHMGMATYTHNDAGETLRYALQSQEAAVLQQRGCTAVFDATVGVTVTTRLCCASCAAETKNDPVTQSGLDLEIVKGHHEPIHSVQDAVDTYLAPLTVESRCVACGHHERSIQYRILTLPDVLVILLKRTVIAGEKVQHAVEADVVLRVPCAGGACTYRLSGVVRHVGAAHTTDAGHYFAEIKADDGTWDVFDDDKTVKKSKNVYAEAVEQPDKSSTTRTKSNAKASLVSIVVYQRVR